MNGTDPIERSWLPWMESRWTRLLIRKTVTFVLLGLVCAWFYSWAAARWYEGGQPAGFRHGLVHGAAMPMALPALVLGQDPPIFAAKHTGRSYKLGYIAGINLCGLVVFGLAFGRPPRRRDSSIGCS